MSARIGIVLASLGALVIACTGLDGLSNGADAGPDASEAGDADTDGGADAVDAGSAVDGCPALADATCKRYAACSPAYLEAAFAGPTTCLARLTAECRSELSQPDIILTAPQVAACAAALATQTCEDLRAGVITAACAVAGRRADGKACAYGEQCASGFCVSSDERGCGVCGKASTVGAACGGGCAGGLACVGGKCVVPGSMGDACDARPCHASLQCVAGHCAAFVPPGGDCDSTNRCDLAQSYACSGGTCVPIAFPAPGEPCGAIPTPNQCASGVCVIPDGGTVGVCAATIAVGGRCGTSTPPCDTLTACIAGECAYPTDAICTP